MGASDRDLWALISKQPECDQFRAWLLDGRSPESDDREIRGRVLVEIQELATRSARPSRISARNVDRIAFIDGPVGVHGRLRSGAGPYRLMGCHGGCKKNLTLKGWFRPANRAAGNGPSALKASGTGNPKSESSLIFGRQTRHHNPRVGGSNPSSATNRSNPIFAIDDWSPRLPVLERRPLPLLRAKVTSPSRIKLQRSRSHGIGANPLKSWGCQPPRRLGRGRSPEKLSNSGLVMFPKRLVDFISPICHF
jgi:hypothetical protein